MTVTSLHDSVQSQERLATLLALIAGYIDAYGFITYATYLSFMSGNTTQIGFRIAEGHFLATLPLLIAIFSFFLGIVIGTLLLSSYPYPSRKKGLLIIVLLLALIIIMTLFGYLNRFIHIFLISFSMGWMNTVINQVGAQLINLTFVTGTLNRIATHIALEIKQMPLLDAQGSWDTHWRRSKILMRIWGAFCLGALLAGMITVHFHVWALLFPLCLLLGLVFFHPYQTNENA